MQLNIGQIAFVIVSVLSQRLIGMSQYTTTLKRLIACFKDKGEHEKINGALWVSKVRMCVQQESTIVP